MSTTSILIFAAFGLVFGLAFFALGFFFRRAIAERVIKNAESRASEIRTAAEREADSIRDRSKSDAERQVAKLRHDFEARNDERRREIESLRDQIETRERTADKKHDQLARKENQLDTRAADIDKIRAEAEASKKQLDELIAKEREILQKTSGLTAEDAKRQLLKRMEIDVRAEASVLIKTIEEEARDIADKKAKHILSLAIQRCAAEHSIETTVSVVQLPSDEMKGRIIGKEGRNVRTFESATGVDLVIDDTPGAVVLSAFDSVRREIARVALERLIEDGRIHPSTIEETVGKVRQEMEKSIREEGEKTVAELNIGPMNPELVYLVGRLKYRTSYGQNSLAHSKEVAFLMNVMAGELGLDPVVARRAGLLHDIGKTASHEVEGPHALIGGEIARRLGESPEVVHAVEAHHGDIEQRSVYTVLVQAADAMSGARPGARRDTLENYIKRLENLEKVAASIPGVERAFAIQAGREVRIMVHPDQVADQQMPALAREVSKKMKEDLQFPGQIRVTVIRETRATEFVK